MLKKNKNYKFLIGVVIGIFLSIPVAYAATTYVAAGIELSYDNSNSTLESTTAQEALDELYIIKNCPSGYTCTKN